MKGYFGGKEVLKVLLGNSVIYSKKGEVVLPPPETIVVPKSDFLASFISYNTNPPTEATSSSNNARMTSWIAVRPNTSYLINEYLTNQCVIQVKNSLGGITSLTQFQGLTSANDVVFPTGNNTFVRIYFYAGSNSKLAKDMTLTEQRG